MGFLKNYDSQGAVNLCIVLSTSSSTPVEFNIQAIGRQLGNGMLPSHSDVEIDIPREYMTRTNSYTERQKGILISTNDSEVSVIAVASNRIGVTEGTSGAYRIFPYRPAPETTRYYEYFAISVEASPGFGLRSEFLLVGNEDNTTITVFPAATAGSIVLPRDAQDGGGETVEITPGGGHTVTLHRLQTLLVTKADADLTGTRIVSSQPVTVLSGHECGNVPRNILKCDHVGVQVRPTSGWGRNFLLIPFLGRPGSQRFKIVAAENDTSVSRVCSGALATSMKFALAGEFYEFHTTSFMSCLVQSDKPLLVVQLSQGFQTDGIGDPAMILVSPVEQYVNKVSVLALNSDLFSNSYITITTTPKHFNPANILLDGEPVVGDWSIVITEESYVIGYGCKVRVTPGHHSVQHNHPNGRLSVLVYGFDSVIRHAYGYIAAVSKSTDTVHGMSNYSYALLKSAFLHIHIIILKLLMEITRFNHCLFVTM